MQVTQRRIALLGLAGGGFMIAWAALVVASLTLLPALSVAPGQPLDAGRGGHTGNTNGPVQGTVLAAGATGVMHVPVWFNGVPINCLVDTGSSLTVINQTMVWRLGTLTETDATVTLRAANGGTLDGRIYSVQHVRAADLVWSASDLAVFPDEQLIVPCILGMNLLGQQSIAIDWSANLLRPVAP